MQPTNINVPKLELINTPTVSTNEAALYLSRKPQTLRSWAAFQKGPIQPLRINGRLAWSVDELKKILGVQK
jgi:hypothetical protein